MAAIAGTATTRVTRRTVSAYADLARPLDSSSDQVI